MIGVFTKLNLRDQREVVVLNAPEGFAGEMAALAAAGVTVRREAEAAGPIAFALAFATTQAEVDRLSALIAERAAGDATVWFAYPKGSSKRYRCEFNRDTGWTALGAAGFEGVRQVAIDEDWSGLRFRRVEYIKTMRRDPQRALSASGKARVTPPQAAEKGP